MIFWTFHHKRDSATKTPNQQRIYNEIFELKELEKQTAKDDETSRNPIFANSHWSDTTLSSKEWQQVEETRNEF